MSPLPTRIKKAALIRAATYLRQNNPPSPEHRALMQAAANLRAIKGLYREDYTLDEQEVVDRGAALCLEHGEIDLRSRLRLNRRSPKRKPPVEYIRKAHECPRCRRLHYEPSPKRTGIATEAEARSLVAYHCHVREEMKHRRRSAASKAREEKHRREREAKRA